MFAVQEGKGEGGGGWAVFPNLRKFIGTFRPKGYDMLHAPFRLRVWYSRALRECINIFIFFSPKKGNEREQGGRNTPDKNAKQDPSWALGRKCASLIHSMKSWEAAGQF